jgi:hypothetical protein
MHFKQIQNAIKHHELSTDSTLHVVAVISNSARYHSRYRIFREWEQRMLATPNVKLYVVEIAFGDRCFEVTDVTNPNHLQLRTNQELWHKENMVNLGVQRLLPRNWKYLAWIDADITFNNDNWALETIHALQHYQVVQPWSECADLGPKGNIMRTHTSFSQLISQGIEPHAPSDGSYYIGKFKAGHPGYAWACTRHFWENVEGLVDFAILGSADMNMSWAMIGKVQKSYHGKLSQDFKDGMKEWQRRAFRVTNGHLGYVPGMITHEFHGAKKTRFYKERSQILVDHGFSPRKHLMRDAQGLWRMVNHPQLQRDISNYMHSRNEDSVDEG